MTSYQWFQVAIVCLMGAMSPGPSLALIIRNTIKKNKTNGIITSISHGLGVSLYALFAVLGLGYLIDTHIEIFLTLKIIGSIFLLIIGFIFLFYAGKKEFDYKNENKFSSSSFVQGFLIAFLNPKILVFFTALFSQFITPNANLSHKIILVITPGIIDTLWYIFVAIFITTTAIKQYIDMHLKKIEQLMGLILILVSVSFIYKFILT